MLFSAKNRFYYLLILCLIILLIPIFLRARYDGGLLIGGDSYTSLRFGQFIHDNKALPIEDSLSYGVRPYFAEYGLPVILALNPFVLAKWLPLILGLLSFIFFYKIVEKVDFKIKDLASLFFIASPAFIFLFSTANKYAIAVLLTLIGIYSCICRKQKLAIFCFGIIGFFSYITSLLILIIYLFYSLKNYQWKNFILLLIFNIITFILQFRKILTLGLPTNFFNLMNYNFETLLRLLFSDLGGTYGIGIFLFLLGIVGVHYMWKEKYRYLLVYIILIILLTLSLYLNFLIYYFAMLISIFAAYAFMQLLEYEWKSEIFKFFTIMIVVCGLLFSTVAYIDRISGFTPTKGFMEGLDFLKEQNISTTVFSHYTRGVYLSYSGKINFMDDGFLYAPNLNGRKNDMIKLFNSNNINEATAIINKYGIGYIWMDGELKNELYGTTEKDLIFLLKYSPQIFTKVFDNKEVEIYKYEPLNLSAVNNGVII